MIPMFAESIFGVIYPGIVGKSSLAAMADATRFGTKAPPAAA